MLLQLKQSDVDQAIRNYVSGLGIACQVEHVTYTAGRGENGLSVDVRLDTGTKTRQPNLVETAAAKVSEAVSATKDAVLGSEDKSADAETDGEVTGKSLFG